jgi:hypothetical protein
MQWQIIAPALALIFVLGIAGAWLTRELWIPARTPEGPTIAVLPYADPDYWKAVDAVLKKGRAA